MESKPKDQLLAELTDRVRSGGNGGKTTADDLQRFLTSLTNQVYARDEQPPAPANLPRVYATNGNGNVAYQGGSLNAAITAVAGGGGLILCFGNVDLTASVTLPISTIIVCHYGIIDMLNNTLTLTDRCRLVQARVQRGIISSNYGALNANTPKYEGGVTYDVPLDVESGCYLIAEGVNFSGIKPWLMRSSVESNPNATPGTGVLRGTTQIYSDTNAAGTTVLDQRGGPAAPTASQVELHLEFEPLSGGFTQVSKDIFVTAPKAGSYTAATFENVSQVQITDRSTNASETRLANAAWAPLALVAGHNYQFLITPTAPAQGGALSLTT